MIYAYADVGRFGLAHSLLPWARAELWAEHNSVTVLAPRWLRLRAGTYLRGERDKRSYFRLFGSGEAIGGLRKYIILLRARRIDEIRDINALPPARADEIAVVVFRSTADNNIVDDFRYLHRRSELLRSKLIAMTHKQYHPSKPEKAHLAAHIRMGDFKAGTSEQLRAGIQNIRTPISWYVECLEKMRENLQAELPLVVFSDGSDEDLAPLLRCANVSRSQNRHAITDLLAIADASALIASGSGFSLWGSYLGQVPRVCHPGQLLTNVLDDKGAEVEIDTGDSLPSSFVAAIKNRIKLRTV